MILRAIRVIPQVQSNVVLVLESRFRLRNALDLAAYRLLAGKRYCAWATGSNVNEQAQLNVVLFCRLFG